MDQKDWRVTKSFTIIFKKIHFHISKTGTMSLVISIVCIWLSIKWIKFLGLLQDHLKCGDQYSFQFQRLGFRRSRFEFLKLNTEDSKQIFHWDRSRLRAFLISLVQKWKVISQSSLWVLRAVWRRDPSSIETNSDIKLFTKEFIYPVFIYFA